MMSSQIQSKTDMFELLPYETFRNTPSVKFYDITVDNSNARDLVVHSGRAISPNDDETGAWQFYMHQHQVDNLLAVSGGRTFYLVNPNWSEPYHEVRIVAGGEILRIPPGTYHRSVSDPGGSIVINQAVRDDVFDVVSEFKIHNSKQIPNIEKYLSSMYNNLESQIMHLFIHMETPPDTIEGIYNCLMRKPYMYEISSCVWQLASTGKLVVESGHIKLKN